MQNEKCKIIPIRAAAWIRGFPHFALFISHFAFPFHRLVARPRINSSKVQMASESRCIAATLGAQTRKPVEMLHNPHECGSVRLPTGGGSLVRFGFL
jgi:hypothetical protein